MLYYDKIDVSEGMLIRPPNQKKDIFVTIGIF